LKSTANHKLERKHGGFGPREGERGKKIKRQGKSSTKGGKTGQLFPAQAWSKKGGQKPKPRKKVGTKRVWKGKIAKLSTKGLDRGK